MPNTSSYVFTGNFLYQNTYCKPRKKSFRKKFGKKISPISLMQNQMRKEFISCLPEKTKSIEDNIFGVDYLYKGLKIDQKFGFGQLGEGAIKIRTKKRQLLNHSDWTLVINRDREIDFFETKKLAEFVKKNWDLVQKRTISKKECHNCHIVYLDELYTNENFVPLKTKIDNKEIETILEEIKLQEIDYANNICLLNLLS